MGFTPGSGYEVIGNVQIMLIVSSVKHNRSSDYPRGFKMVRIRFFRIVSEDDITNGRVSSIHRIDCPFRQLFAISKRTRLIDHLALCLGATDDTDETDYTDFKGFV